MFLSPFYSQLNLEPHLRSYLRSEKGEKSQSEFSRYGALKRFTGKCKSAKHKIHKHTLFSGPADTQLCKINMQTHVIINVNIIRLTNPAVSMLHLRLYLI